MVNETISGAGVHGLVRACRIGAAATLFAVLAGCASSQGGEGASAVLPPPAPLVSDPQPSEPAPGQQPRYAAYACEGGGSLTVENFQTSALVVAPRRESAELPASPPGQTRRYAAPPYVLELDGTRASFSRKGRRPLSCVRTEP
ncbi:MAG: hypothetical protein INR68_08550 [Methylobacterium mesophilicum]|nr:hypothetical protein [Methylobacterium mesophilicum]